MHLPLHYIEFYVNTCPIHASTVTHSKWKSVTGPNKRAYLWAFTPKAASACMQATQLCCFTTPHTHLHPQRIRRCRAQQRACRAQLLGAIAPALKVNCTKWLQVHWCLRSCYGCM